MCTSQIISIFFFDLFAHNIAIVSGAKIKTLEIMKHYHTYNAYYINWNDIMKKKNRENACAFVFSDTKHLLHSNDGKGEKLP